MLVWRSMFWYSHNSKYAPIMVVDQKTRMSKFVLDASDLVVKQRLGI